MTLYRIIYITLYIYNIIYITLYRGITSNNNGEFYFLNCLHSYETQNKLKKCENVCKNYDYCYVEMPNKDNKILKYNHGQKSMKVPFIIYVYLESLLKKISSCHNNPEISSTTKINKHTPSVYSLFTHYLFDLTNNKLDCYRGKDCMERFCKDLKENATKIINYKKRNDTTN